MSKHDQRRAILSHARRVEPRLSRDLAEGFERLRETLRLDLLAEDISKKRVRRFNYYIKPEEIDAAMAIAARDVQGALLNARKESTAMARDGKL